MRVYFRLTDKPGREDAGEDPPATGGQKSVPDSGSIVYSRHKSVVLTQKGWKTVSFGVSCRLWFSFHMRQSTSMTDHVHKSEDT